MKDKILIGIIEDNKTLRENYCEYFNEQPKFEVSFSRRDLNNIQAEADQLTTPDIILLDISLPGVNGIEGILTLKQLFPGAKVVMLSSYYDQKFVLSSIGNGAAGYLTKNMPLEQICDSLNSLWNNGTPLSPVVAKILINSVKEKNDRFCKFKELLTLREFEIVENLAKGYTYQQVGEVLEISAGTVNQHLKSIYIKLNVHSKAQLIAKIYQYQE